MRTLIILIALSLMAAPVSAQFYSYRDANGKLHITDRPVKKKGYKLLDTYIPKTMKERQEKAERTRKRYASKSKKKGGKNILTKEQVVGLVNPIARSMGVDPELVVAVIQIESSRNVRAESNKGAMGLMQLIPETAERFGVSNPWDPRQNVKGGIRYLQYLLSYFEGNVDYVLAAYNAGENAVDKHGGIPPYKETRRYVKKIRKIYQVETLPYGDAARYRSALVRKDKKKKAKKVAVAD